MPEQNQSIAIFIGEWAMRWVRWISIGLGSIFLLAVAGLCILWYQGFGPPLKMVDPVPHGRRIAEPGLLANYYPGEGEGPHIPVLLIGGSEGGLNPWLGNVARGLQQQGISTLHISYWRAPGQTDTLELIPLETFDRGVAWLKRQPYVDPQRIAIIGLSRGSEAATLTAIRHPEIRTLVAAMPSSAVWGGFRWERQWFFDSAWSIGGKPVPFIDPSFGLDDTGTAFYNRAFAETSPDSSAWLAIEQVRGRALLICGEKDNTWLSCPMARQLIARKSKRGGPELNLLAYPKAGHQGFGHPVAGDGPALQALGAWGGGTATANAEARADMWPKMVAYLKGGASALDRE